MINVLSALYAIKKLQADIRLWDEIANDERMKPATRAYYADLCEGAKLKLKKLQDKL